MVRQIEFTLPPLPKGFHLITQVIREKLTDLPDAGLLHILLKHTSAAITINENADSTVRNDFSAFFNRLIPEGLPYFEHNMEGDDDMPAHLKASILGQELTIPISSKHMNLGTWQGIYFCEFRDHPTKRKIILTIIG